MNQTAESVETERQKELSIDLRGIFAALLHRFWIILLAVLAGGVLAFFISYVQKPTYASSATLFVTGISVNSEEQTPNSSTQSTAASLAKSLQELITYREPLKEVSELLEQKGIVNPETGEKYTYSDLVSMVTVKYSGEKPQILSIYVTCGDGETSREVTNVVQEVAARYLTDKSMTRVNVGNTAGTGSRTNNDMVRNLMIGALIGALLAIIGILIAFFADDKIKTAEDIEKHLGISVLGQIPKSEKLNEPTASRRHRSARQKKKKKEAAAK